MKTYIPKNIPEGINTSQQSALKDLGQMALIVGLIGFFLYWLAGFSAEYLAKNISFKTEQRLSSDFSLWDVEKLVSKKKKPPNTDALTQLVNKLWEPFDKNRNITFEISVLQSNAPNAFMSLGGKMGITKGLVERAGSENEIVFVLCHELGHFYHRHILRHLGRKLVMATVLSIISTNGSSGALESGLSLGELTHSRAWEEESDQFGVTCMNNYYGHVNGYSDFFNRIKKFEDKIPAKKVFRYINTHPLSDLRIENLKSYAEDQGYQLQGEKTPWKWEPTPNRQAP